MTEKKEYRIKQIPLNAKGRGAQINPDKRFSKIQIEEDFEYLEHDEEAREALRNVKTQYFVDTSRSILNDVNSFDVPFQKSINVYRGCAHGCSYCYARPYHEYLDLNAGLDFETKIFVKENAPNLLRDELASNSWKPQIIMMSGVTDCYQPAEKHFKLTRQCLEVMLEARQPVAIITKNSLVTRDIDILKEMAAHRLVSVALSITSLDQSLIRQMEPRTSAPAARLRAIATLTENNIPAHVMVAPVVPGLTDSEIPAILKEASKAGAISAGYSILRLPLTVEPVFLEWLHRTQPSHAERVLSYIRATRAGELSESTLGKRMSGSGALAEQIKQTFQLFARKYNVNNKRIKLDTTNFRAPRPSSGQMWLFPR